MLQSINEYSPSFNSAALNEQQDEEQKIQQKKLTYEEESTSETELLQGNCRDYVMKKYISPQKQLSHLLDDVESSSNTQCRTSSEKKILELLAPLGRESLCNSYNNSNSNINNNPYTQQNQQQQQQQLQQSQTKCPEHTDEDLLFICFSCEKKCVCIECISNGQHKGHDVKNIKKAKREIKQLVQEILVKLKSKIENYAVESDKLDGKKNEIVEISNELKKSIRFNFEELREILAKKEQELISSADDFLLSKAGVIDQSLVRLRRRMNIFIESHRLVEECVADLDETSLCNYFYRKSRILNELVEEGSSMHGLFMETKKIEKTLKEAFDFQCFFDSKALKNYLENIQLIKVESASLRGVESISAVNIDANKVTFSATQMNNGSMLLGGQSSSNGSGASSRMQKNFDNENIEYEQEQAFQDIIDNNNNISNNNNGIDNCSLNNNNNDITNNQGLRILNCGDINFNYNNTSTVNSQQGGSYNNEGGGQGNSIKTLSNNVSQLKKQFEKNFHKKIGLNWVNNNNLNSQNNNNNNNSQRGINSSASTKNLQLASILSPPTVANQQTGKESQSPGQKSSKQNLNDFWIQQQQKLKKTVSQPKINPFSVQQQQQQQQQQSPQKNNLFIGKEQNSLVGSSSIKKFDINYLFDISTPNNGSANSNNAHNQQNQSALNNSIFNNSQNIKNISHQHGFDKLNEQINQLQEDLNKTLNRDQSMKQLSNQKSQNQFIKHIKNLSQLDQYQQNVQKIKRDRLKNYSLHQIDTQIKLPNYNQYKSLAKGSNQLQQLQQ